MPDRRDIEEAVALARAMGERCNGHPEMVDDAFPQVVALLDGESEPEVLVAIANAFGHMWDSRCLDPLLLLVDHEDRAVRLAVTQALVGALCDDERDEGLAAVVRLTRDGDDEIRDWATFTLAQCDADTAEIRAALWERIAENTRDTAGEALVGLARRRDPLVRDRILRLLELDPGNLIVEAAAELGDPSLHAALVQLKEAGWAEDDPRPHILDEALAACDSGRPLD